VVAVAGKRKGDPILLIDRRKFLAGMVAMSDPVAGIDYHNLINDPGDAVVTRSSLVGHCRAELLPGFEDIAPLRVSHSMFLCEQHQFLTGNPIFQNNLLHTLFRREPARA